jgi:hypothetical protein
MFRSLLLPEKALLQSSPDNSNISFGDCNHFV